MKKNKEENLNKIAEYLSVHPCVICGEENILTLEFDHKENKKVDVGVIASSPNATWDDVLKEINKCDVKCANCHRKKTNAEQQSYRWKYYVEHILMDEKK